MEILRNEVYTNGKELVLTDEVDQERATVIFEVITGADEGKSKIYGFGKFRKEYQEV